ncbi:unnamed protein product [Blepharisma stoltei]|uniref:SET domain-containing protein n=1 Tax=Blepharisma stoltei TaxID=1481888 RepID=A0AAU9KCD7_9CILI|nr:unnamed protein product [Blepharisma stoltei]
MEHLFKTAPAGLIRAWQPIEPSIYFPIRVKSQQEAIGLIADTDIPFRSTILEIKHYIPGFKLLHIPQMKSQLISDVFQYLQEIHPHKPDLHQRLNIGFQISYISRNLGHILHDYLDSWPTDYKKSSELYQGGRTNSWGLSNANSLEKSMLIETYETIYKNSKGYVAGVSEPEHQWSLIESYKRAINTNDGLCVIPLMDHMNHAYKPNCEIYRELGSYSLIAERDIKAGEELTRNFGNLSSVDFLWRFGFLDEDNPDKNTIINAEVDPSWPDLLRKFGITDNSPITELDNPNNYTMKSLKKALLKKYNITELSEFKITRPPLPDMEKVHKILFWKLKDFKDIGIKSVEDILNLDFSQEVCEKVRDRANYFIYLTMLQNKRIKEAKKNSNPVLAKFEDIEYQLFLENENYYFQRLGKFADKAKNIKFG